MDRGCFVWTSSPPLAGRRTPHPAPVRVCVCSSFLAGSGGPASRARFGAPLLFLWPLCLSALLGTLQVGIAPFVVLWLPSPLPPPLFFLLLPAVPFSARPPCLWLSVFPAPGALGLGAVCCLFCWLPAPGLSVRSGLFSGSRLAVGCSPVVVAPPPPLLCLAVFLAAALCSVFLFSRCAPPLSLGFSGFWPRVPWALALCAVRFVGLPLLGSPCPLASFVVPAWPIAALWWLLPPPPPFVSRCFSRCRSLLCFFFSLRAPVISGFLPFRAPGSLGLGAVCCLFCWPPAPRLSVRSRLFYGSRLAVGCTLVVAAPNPLFCVSLFFSLPLCAPFFFTLRAPVVSGSLWFPTPGALGLGAVCCLFCWPPASRLSVRSRLFCVSRLTVGCFLVFAAPTPLCVLRFSSLRLSALFFFSLLVQRFSLPAPPPSLVRFWCLVLSGVAALCCPSVLRAVLWCLALLCCGLLRAVRCLLGCLFPCCAALLVAAACCAVSLIVLSSWVVLGVPGFCLRCRVSCCAV